MYICACANFASFDRDFVFHINHLCSTHTQTPDQLCRLRCASLATSTHVRLRLNTFQWRHNEGDGISNHRRFHCLLNCWFRHRSKKTSKLRVTGLCVGNSPVAGEFPTQKASNAQNVSIWWRHHEAYRQTCGRNRTRFACVTSILFEIRTDVFRSNFDQHGKCWRTVSLLAAWGRLSYCSVDSK